MSDSRVGLTVTHRRYVPYAHAHYAGNLVDGAYALGLFGDVATEVCIRTDGDEGLFASYAEVQFLAAVRAGDVVEVTATVVRVGTRGGGRPHGRGGARDVRHDPGARERGREAQGRALEGALLADRGDRARRAAAVLPEVSARG